VENELNNATDETATMLNAGLELLMSDMPSFVHFASTGMFSGSETLSLSQEFDGLDTALRTIIVSNAMSHNGWHATPIIGVTRDDVASSVMGNSCSWHGPNNAFCGDFIWYSDITMNAFIVASAKNLTGTMGLLKDIVENKWSTMPMLLDGSYNCTVAGNHGTSPVHVQLDGVLNMSCMSQLIMCLPCGAKCPIDLVDGVCPFGPCTAETHGKC